MDISTYAAPLPPRQSVVTRRLAVAVGARPRHAGVAMGVEDAEPARRLDVGATGERDGLEAELGAWGVVAVPVAVGAADDVLHALARHRAGLFAATVAGCSHGDRGRRGGNPSCLHVVSHGQNGSPCSATGVDTSGCGCWYQSGTPGPFVH